MATGITVHRAAKIEVEHGDLESGKAWTDIIVTDENGGETTFTIFTKEDVEITGNLNR
jgi:hypothetical protein